MAKFPERLRKLRKEKGKSIRDAAKDLGIGKTTLSNYERGERTPKSDFVKKAADYYNASTDYLLCKTDVKYNAYERITKAIEDDPELLHFWEDMKDENIQLLFKQTRKLSDDDIKAVIEIIKRIEKEEDEIYG